MSQAEFLTIIAKNGAREVLLDLALHLIGRKTGARFVIQSRRVAIAIMQLFSTLSFEKCCIVEIL